MASLFKDKDKRRMYHIFGAIVLLCVLAVMSVISKTDYNLFYSGLCDYSEGWDISYSNETGSVIEDNITLDYSNSYIVNEEGIHISKTIGDDVKEGSYIFVESDNQDIAVYVDGEYAGEYGGGDIVAFGISRPFGFFYVPIYSSYQGKQIDIYINSSIPEKRTHINSVYVGTETQFISFLFDKYGIDILGGSLFVLIGFLWLVLYSVIQAIYKRATDIHYIGVFGIMMGVYTLFNCRGRQLYIDDVFFAEKASYILLACLCIPCILFGMERMKFRYKRSAVGICLMNGLNAFVCLVLDILGITDMSVSVVSTQVIIIISIFYAIWAITDDCCKGHLKEIKDIVIGFSILMITALFNQITILILGQENKLANIALYIGIIILMLVMGRGNILAWVKSEDEKLEAEHASKAKSTFLANMSHEIRTPISAILGMDEMILRETDNEAIKGYAGNIRNAGNILLSIVNDILDFSKIESGKMELVETEYETVGMLNDVMIMMKKRAEDKGLQFITKVSPDIPVKMYGDDVRIRQIITNIISNAVKYTRTGSVTFSISSDDIVNSENGKNTVLHVSIKDTGIGIKAEDMDKLFDSFMRLDEKHNKNIEGTGLGMSITTHFLKLMKSELKVNSVYGEGSEFSFDLPQLVLDDSKIGNYEEAYKKYEATMTVSHSGFSAPDAKILAVDDNEMNLEVLTGLLKETQMKVTTTTRGAKAIELLKDYSYDLVLLDHMMPGLDGIETLKKIRELEAVRKEKGEIKQDTPVIVLTANAISGAREMYLEAGFQDYLTKPIVCEELDKILIKYLPGRLIQPRINNEKNTDTLTKKENTSADNQNKENKSDEVEDVIQEYIAKFGINVDDGIKYSGGKPGKYKLMLGAFVKFDSSRREKLKNAFDSGDIKNYAIEAHALKSNARSIGANRLADMAYEHEKAGKASNEEFVKGEYRFLIEELDSTMKGVEKILKDDILLQHTVASDKFAVKDTSEKKTSGVVPITMSELVNGIKMRDKNEEKIIVGDNSVRNNNILEIKKSVEQYDRKEALSLLKSWRKKERNDIVVVALSRIEKSLQDFEFDKALSEISVLQSRIGA